MEHENRVSDLAVTRDGTKIISGDDYGEIKVWDVTSYELVNAWTQGALCPVISISPDDRLIAVGG